VITLSLQTFGDDPPRPPHVQVVCVCFFRKDKVVCLVREFIYLFIHNFSKIYIADSKICKSSLEPLW
jgi:hypothetical protein